MTCSLLPLKDLFLLLVVVQQISLEQMVLGLLLQVVEVPRLQDLLHHICSNGFEHHVVMTRSHTADVLAEAFSKYLKWDTYRHEA